MNKEQYVVAIYDPITQLNTIYFTHAVSHENALIDILKKTTFKLANNDELKCCVEKIINPFNIN